jgi:AcrR family transcriptional regulator
VPRAGLGPAAVTFAGAALADEVGLDHLSMGSLAERLGVRTPSLYCHVDSIDDLTHRIGVLAMGELAAAIGDATQGRSGREALVAAARAMRGFVNDCPGRYAAGNAARPTGPDDPLITATGRFLGSLSSALHGYRLDPDGETHALRTMRSLLHGFASLEAAGGFAIRTDVDDTFTWMIDLLHRGLDGSRAASGAPHRPSTPETCP